MPTISSVNLTLTTVGPDVTINVKYQVVFTPFERHLAGLGLIFRERIAVLGIDPPGSFTGTLLTNFPSPNLPVTDGNVPQTITRNETVTRTRASLQEDPFDADEIRARIRIGAVGFPPAETPDVFTDQEILLG